MAVVACAFSRFFHRWLSAGRTALLRPVVLPRRRSPLPAELVDFSNDSPFPDTSVEFTRWMSSQRGSGQPTGRRATPASDFLVMSALPGEHSVRQGPSIISPGGGLIKELHSVRLVAQPEGRRPPVFRWRPTWDTIVERAQVPRLFRRDDDAVPVRLSPWCERFSRAAAVGGGDPEQCSSCRRTAIRRKGPSLPTSGKITHRSPLFSFEARPCRDHHRPSIDRQSAHELPVPAPLGTLLRFFRERTGVSAPQPLGRWVTAVVSAPEEPARPHGPSSPHDTTSGLAYEAHRAAGEPRGDPSGPPGPGTGLDFLLQTAVEVDGAPDRRVRIRCRWRGRARS